MVFDPHPKSRQPFRRKPRVHGFPESTFLTSKVRSFVRILQKGADLRRNPRGFPRCALLEKAAHLRTKLRTFEGRARPAPGGDDPARRRDSHRLRPRSVCLEKSRSPWLADCVHGRSFGAGELQLTLPQALGMLRRCVSMRAGPAIKRAVPGLRIRARLRISEIYRSPCTVFLALLYARIVVFVKIS